MALYATGTVSVTAGSTTVSGSGTSWFGSLQAGWIFVGPDGVSYGISDVVSATQITLTRNYMGVTAAAQSYECFPTMSLAGDLAASFQSLISQFQGIIDAAGAGKFENGTESAPGITFTADPDTGLRRAGSNDVALVAGGSDQLRLSGGAASGDAVQADKYDATPGKLLTAGAFGLGLAGSNTNQWDSDDLDDITISGFWRYATTTVNAPTGSGVVIHVNKIASAGIGQMMQLAIGASGELNVRHLDDGSGWSDWVQHATLNASGELDLGGLVTLSEAGDDMVFKTNGTEAARLDDSGNLGIGTSSPSHLLDINGQTIRLRTPRTISSPTETGSKGEICFNNSYIFYCHATDNWIRFAKDGTWT